MSAQRATRLPSLASDPDAVRRIVDTDLPDGQLTEGQVIDGLTRGGGPRITDKVAGGIAEALVTTEDLEAALEQDGQVPEDIMEIHTKTEQQDQYGMSSRVDQIASAAGERFVTKDKLRENLRTDNALTDSDVRSAIANSGELIGGTADGLRSDILTVEDVVEDIDSRRTDDPIFREDVEETVNSRAGGEFNDPERSDKIKDMAASQLGAPSRDEFRQTGADTLRSGRVDIDENDPRYPDYTGKGERVSVVRDTDGEIVGVVGSNRAARVVANAEGAETITGGVSAFSVKQEPGRAVLTFNGSEITEVEV